MSPQYGELRPITAEIGLPDWGTRANFNRFRVLSSLLQRRRSSEAKQAVSCAGTLYTFSGALAPSPYAQVLAFSYVGSVTARLSSSGPQPNFAAWYKEQNYSTFADGAICIWLGGHHVGHRPTF